MMDVESIREDFTVLKTGVAYFDSACMALKPRQVVEAQDEYYSDYPGCAGRSLHRLGKKTEEKFEEARSKVATFVSCSPEEVVFTRNTTEAINLVARTLDFTERNGVTTSVMEHHSALLPFMMLSKHGKIRLDYVAADVEGVTQAGEWRKKINSSTRLVVVHHTTNSVGTRAPLAEVIKAAHDAGALVLVDSAQGVPHCETNFKKLGADFMAFSGHKMLGPTGTGCLVARRELLEELPPFMTGGETVERVSLDSVTFLKPPQRFEAGLQNYAGMIGLGAACDYLSKVGMKNVEAHEHALASKLFEALSDVKGTRIYGPSDAGKRTALAAFNLGKAKPHEIAMLLDKTAKIAVRSGVFCAEPAMTHLGTGSGAVRASLYLYNTEEEVQLFGEALSKIAELY
ncbi:TPA: aminotransferase class V-fold PLP-dependent enzyme [Candidatus Micrarchaeota archaeon]|nr:aminotransferase class V-fold PLP-dependent enzyme [Candidatus Micrarchaeota archaeon]